MYRIGICDDDKVFCADLEERLYRISEAFFEKVEIEVWYSGEDIMRDICGRTLCDLLFLDIELVKKDGIEVGRFIRDELEDMRTQIVYVSSKQDYAMQLFKVQPLDFLIKPVSDKALAETLSRSVRRQKSADICFEYKKGGIMFRIPTSDIAYFASTDKKIRIVKKSGEEEFYGKLKSIADRLPADFMPIHQSYIVNRRYVSEYSYDTVKMADKTVLSISKPYRKAVRERLKQFRKAEMEDWDI